MRFAPTAQGRWQQLDGTRRGFINRCELYAGYTLPKICLPDSFDQNSTQMAHDFQAVGAQAVNHLSNKMMLSLFAPSSTFFRLDASNTAKAVFADLKMDEEEITPMLAKVERDAVALLDRLALRPKLYEAVKHLIITGNVLMCLEDDGSARVIGLKRYVVRRSMSGRVIELMIADKVLMDELEEGVQDVVRAELGYAEDRTVTLYRWFHFKGGDYHMTQWVDNIKLPNEFDGKWPEKDLPYRVLTWDLADGENYGTGLVEDYSSDFSGLSALSKAQVQGAILASEFRWLVNPAGQTRVEDFADTPNGGAMPGTEGDITIIESGKSRDLQVTLAMTQEYVNRIGRGFLLGSLLVRQAERVTAEEIRMTANELETALGGGYSRLALDFQAPMAKWLLEQLKVKISDKFDVTVITGLDALSRTSDLDDAKLWLADMGSASQLPEQMQARIKWNELGSLFATPRRVDISRIWKSDQEMAAEQQAAQQQQQEMVAAEAGAQMAVDAAGQEGQ